MSKVVGLKPDAAGRSTTTPKAGGGLLQRGGSSSFMERKKAVELCSHRNVITLDSGPSRIRSLSLSLSGVAVAGTSSRLNSPSSIPKTPPASPNRRHEWDTESNTSGISVASCDHASVALNGTTFSGRSRRYMVHCSEHSGATGDDYLTPTQRAHQQVKRLKRLLQQAHRDLDAKDGDILRLTKEVVELRLYKAALGSPEEKSTSSCEAVTVVDLVGSCTDSGHFDDLGDDLGLSPGKSDKSSTANLDRSEQQLILEYERRLQELIHTHEHECYQLKQRHNDKVEELLQRLSEVNARYWELVPDLDTARNRIRELEQHLDTACKKLELQGATTTCCCLAGPSQDAPTRISVPDLLHQLEVTQTELDNVKAMYRQLMEARSKNKIDPEITLQFLKSAIYYFLTDKENNQGHLRAIQNILGFTPSEISNIDKARLA